VRLLVNPDAIQSRSETMYARVTIGQMQIAKLDEAMTIYRDSVVPAAKQQKGFKGLYVLTDGKTGKGLTIALWETEADMRAGETGGYYQQQVAKFKDLLAAPPVREDYEVVLQP
jgi:heme-degrading monooxygenase HmoA